MGLFVSPAAGRAVAMAPRNTRAKVRATRAILICVIILATIQLVSANKNYLTIFIDLD